MYSLFYGFYEYLFRKARTTAKLLSCALTSTVPADPRVARQAEYRILILGVDKAGKTTLLEKIKSLLSTVEGLPSNQILPTVGAHLDRTAC